MHKSCRALSFLHAEDEMMGLFRKSFCLAVFCTLVLASAAWSDGNKVAERIFYNGKIFTAEPEHPYAEAVAIRGDKIVGVGNLSEGAERVNLEGKSLLPGFIDSHSHSVEGGINLISAEVGEDLKSLDELAAFAAEAKKSGRGMRGDILEILGLPLQTWSHIDELNGRFNAGSYENQAILLRGMDGHTGWANRALLKRAGISRDFLKKLSEGERSYYGAGKDFDPNGFVVDAGTDKIMSLLPKPSDERLLAAARAALQYNYSLGITAWLDPLADEDVLKAYRLVAEHGDLLPQVDAF